MKYSTITGHYRRTSPPKS